MVKRPGSKVGLNLRDPPRIWDNAHVFSLRDYIWVSTVRLSSHVANPKDTALKRWNELKRGKVGILYLKMPII